VFITHRTQTKTWTAVTSFVPFESRCPCKSKTIYAISLEVILQQCSIQSKMEYSIDKRDRTRSVVNSNLNSPNTWRKTWNGSNMFKLLRFRRFFRAENITTIKSLQSVVPTQSMWFLRTIYYTTCRYSFLKKFLKYFSNVNFEWNERKYCIVVTYHVCVNMSGD